MGRGWINYAGAFVLILTGIFLYSLDPNFPIAGATPLALLLFIAGLVWGGLALNDPLTRRGYHRFRDGSLRAGPSRGAGYRTHRSSKYLAARHFAGRELPWTRGVGRGRDVIALNASAAAGGSFAKDSLRIAAREAGENFYSARGSMWAVLSGIVLSLISSNLLLTGEAFSRSEQSQVLCTITSLAVGLGLLVAGILAADPVADERERATSEGALLFGKVWGVASTWLVIFGISAPYIMVVGFGTSVSWMALVYTFVLGGLCVAGYATLILGISALSRSGRGVTLASVAIFIVMTAPTLLGTALDESWFGAICNALSPFAQVRLVLDSAIADKESLLVQLPHIGALAAFATIAAIFAAFAVRGVSPDGVMGGMRGARV
jgi:hypothetical protein